MSAASRSSGGKTSGGLGADQRLILILLAVMLVLIVGVSVLAPKQSEDSPVPSATNTGPLGVRAAYLILEQLGHRTSQWTGSLDDLNASLTEEQAARTTWVLIDPAYDATQEAEFKTQITRFLKRGGQVMTTGDDGARLLGGKVEQSLLDSGICFTQPEGESDLANAGNVQIENRGGWKLDDKQFNGDNLRVSQRCGKAAVVVQFTEPGTGGKGSAVWWTSDAPMTNLELKQDPSLKLMLASIGNGRDVIFDDAMHTGTRSMWDAAKGLPLSWISLQAVALFVLLVFSFSRRRGPIRMPVTLPRSSPVEFASSMGDLYEKGEATSAVTEAAKRRLFRMLTQEVGLSQEAVMAGPDAISEALQTRLGKDSVPLAKRLAAHLREANEAQHAKISQKSVLKLVQAMSEDRAEIRAMLTSSKGSRGVIAEELEMAGAKERR